MSNFEETTEDVENSFLTNPEDVSFLVGTMIELGNLTKKIMMQLIVED